MKSLLSVIGLLALAYITYQWLNTPTPDEVEEKPKPKAVETTVVKEPDKEPDTDMQRLKSERKCVKCDFSGEDLSGLQLKGVDLNHALLRKVNLKGSDLREANLEGANLEGANLEGVNLMWSNLKQANLKNTNLGSTDFRGAELEGALGPSGMICSDSLGKDCLEE